MRVFRQHFNYIFLRIHHNKFIQCFMIWFRSFATGHVKHLKDIFSEINLDFHSLEPPPSPPKKNRILGTGEFMGKISI